MEIGGVQVEPDPDEDPGSEPRAVVPAGVGDCICGNLKGERLLREHLLELARRDPESLGSKRELINAVTAWGFSLTWALEPGRVLHSPPVGQLVRCAWDVAAEYPFLKGPQPLKGAVVRGHANDRNGDGGQRLGRFAGGLRRLRYPFFDQGMSVDSAEAEPADRGAAGFPFSSSGPGLGLAEDPERAAPRLVQARRRGRKVRGRRERLMLEGEENFQEAGRPRRRQGVADVRLHRTDCALAGGPSLGSPEGPQADELDGVTDRRAGRVAFDEVDVARVPA